MKKCFLIFMFFLMIFAFSYSDYIKYTNGRLDNQAIRFLPDTIIYNQSGEFIINLSKENLSDKGQVFYGVGFIKGPGMGHDFNLSFD
ncbi:hypothetical protein KAU33_00215, partial [Candidatus Dependentiae bacterium]|nr:hypothetical protein [Candidatus Dependentiae bacterium]